MRLDTSVFYHLYPLSACGVDIHGQRQPANRLAVLDPWIDYAAELGFTGLLLGPIFQSTAHGYDTIDHFRIDDRLGDNEAFDRFMARCRKAGLDVILDGVFNHVGVLHEFVEGGGPIAHDQAGQPLGWEGDGTLVELDHDDPRTEDLVVEVMNYWLDRGIAGWRLDVAYAVPTDFWRRVLARVREQHPKAIFIGEMIHGDYADFVQASTIDTTTQYELWKAIWSSLKDANFFELSHALGRHEEFSQVGPMQTFIGNHDVDRIVSLVGEDKARLAAVALMFLPGIPSVYYGDERAAYGAKGEGRDADLALRPALDELPPENDMTKLYRHLIGTRRNNDWIATAPVEVVEVENEKITFAVRAGDREAVTHLSLVDGAHAIVHLDGEQVVAF